MVQRVAIAMLVLALMPLAASAKRLGVYGDTYEIAEPDLLKQLQDKARTFVASGQWDEKKKAIKKRAKAYAQRPPGTTLPRALKKVIRWYDPSVRLADAVVDAQGKVLIPAGTTANPLDYMTFTREIILFDGDDPLQREWVHKRVAPNPAHYVLILTNGPIMQLMKRWDLRLYFDQHGTYVRRFGVQALPAVVRQDGRKLRITEVPLS